MEGTVEEASLSYIIRDHSRELFEQKKDLLKQLVTRMNETYAGSTTLVLKDQYYNMREIVEPKKHIVDLAFQAMKAYPWRNRWRTPLFHGTALSELVYRRT